MNPRHNHKQCINRALQEAETLCHRQALQFTALRRQVLKIVWESHRPQKAYDILKKISGNAKPPTVYRALNFLQTAGLAHKLNSQKTYVGCSHPLTKPHCCHFLICTKCGQYAECCDSALTRAIRRVTDKNNFSQIQTTIEIEGVCARCT
ncbi:transcriptional repressor [Candidatus Persebacteraceae bacterium Df01]|uniref:Transcriptional repressor n=1 Tax=Candidatus Doriopsillibacter californiensis TaxID=2970740 RepID=A0ABT7QN96_9GAMM|nr:transcriptional repressor [Candidatus Persebacteraceae bacterium Df01]